MLVKRHIEQAAAFLECLYNIDLVTDKIEATYEGETPEEEDKIAIKGLKIGKVNKPLPLTFDMLTRAFMAAEEEDGPRFQSTLVKAARNALFSEQYIDSFRFSFLLMESLYGDGQFKNAALKGALKGSAGFVAIIEKVLKEPIPPKKNQESDTSDLLANSPCANDVISHLVDKRGFYFHGNRKRQDAWQPHEQDQAEHLALLAVGIAQEIAQEAAAPIFNAEYGLRHFENAMNAGAKIVFEIKFKFREHDEQFSRDGVLHINTPGTKVTGKSANAVAQQFLQHFDHHSPVAALERALCVVQGSDQKVFEITFHGK